MQAPSVRVKLGEFTFMNMEVPNKIPLGGEQMLAVQKLVGGTRIIDALGPDPVNLDWTGWFIGGDALLRAQYLDRLRVLGKPLKLTWSSLSFSVVIEKFIYEYEFEYRLPYKISCVVVSDDNNPVTKLVEQEDWDRDIEQDMQKADEAMNGLTKELTLYDKLMRLWNTIKTIIKTVKKIALATVKLIKDIKSKIKAFQNMIKRAIASITNILKQITTLGGIFPNNSVAKNAMKMMHTVSHYNNLIQLDNIQHLMGHTMKTINRVRPTSGTTNTTTSATKSTLTLPTTLTVNRASLYHLASKYYGNPMKWTLIANANNLTSAYVTTPMTLTIPKDGVSTGGNL